MNDILIFRCLIILSLAITILSCEKDEERRSELFGKWVELTNRQDTINFDSWGSDGFTLWRGYELRNGYMLPKYGSGPYNYKLMLDTIMINYGFSSCMCYSSYYFQMNTTSNTFIIGNFYDTTLASYQHITFFRIK